LKISNLSVSAKRHHLTGHASLSISQGKLRSHAKGIIIVISVSLKKQTSLSYLLFRIRRKERNNPSGD
jgi:hypothetical protein